MHWINHFESLKVRANCNKCHNRFINKTLKAGVCRHLVLCPPLSRHQIFFFPHFRPLAPPRSYSFPQFIERVWYAMFVYTWRRRSRRSRIWTFLLSQRRIKKREYFLTVIAIFTTSLFKINFHIWSQVRSPALELKIQLTIFVEDL